MARPSYAQKDLLKRLNKAEDDIRKLKIQTYGDEAERPIPPTVKGFYASQPTTPEMYGDGTPGAMDLSFPSTPGAIDLWWENAAYASHVIGTAFDKSDFNSHSIRREWWPQPDGFVVEDASPDSGTSLGRTWICPESAHYQMSVKLTLNPSGDAITAGGPWAFHLMLTIQGSVAGWDFQTYDPANPTPFYPLRVDESLWISQGDQVKAMLRGRDTSAEVPGPGLPNTLAMSSVFGGPISGHADTYSATGGHFSAAKLGREEPELPVEGPFAS